ASTRIRRASRKVFSTATAKDFSPIKDCALNVLRSTSVFSNERSVMPTRIASDDELMQAVAAGNQAFAELQRRHRSRVLRLIRAFVHDAQQAEDLTQEVFCRLHTHVDSYAASGQFIPWLKRLAINLAKNFLRRQRQRPLVPLDECENQRSQDERLDPMVVLQ